MNAIPPLSLVFMGSADFAVPALDALVAAGHRIRAVYAQPPRPAGRGHRERPCPVHARAIERGLPVRTPATLKSHQEQQAFAEFDADAAVVAAYGLLLPWPVLTAPRLGCLNIHASLLPRWRGAAPIQRAIEAGDAETGITIMQMDEGLDTGAILARRSIPIPPDATGRTLHDALAAIGAETIVETLAAVAAGRLSATPQPHDSITYAAKIDRDQGRLDWREPADTLAVTVLGDLAPAQPVADRDQHDQPDHGPDGKGHRPPIGIDHEAATPEADGGDTGNEGEDQPEIVMLAHADHLLRVAHRVGDLQQREFLPLAVIHPLAG